MVGSELSCISATTKAGEGYSEPNEFTPDTGLETSFSPAASV